MCNCAEDDSSINSWKWKGTEQSNRDNDGVMRVREADERQEKKSEQAGTSIGTSLNNINFMNNHNILGYNIFTNPLSTISGDGPWLPYINATVLFLTMFGLLVSVISNKSRNSKRFLSSLFEFKDGLTSRWGITKRKPDSTWGGGSKGESIGTTSGWTSSKSLSDGAANWLGGGSTGRSDSTTTGWGWSITRKDSNDTTSGWGWGSSKQTSDEVTTIWSSSKRDSDNTTKEWGWGSTKQKSDDATTGWGLGSSKKKSDDATKGWGWGSSNKKSDDATRGWERWGLGSSKRDSDVATKGWGWGSRKQKSDDATTGWGWGSRKQKSDDATTGWGWGSRKQKSDDATTGWGWGSSKRETNDTSKVWGWGNTNHEPKDTSGWGLIGTKSGSSESESTISSWGWGSTKSKLGDNADSLERISDADESQTQNPDTRLPCFCRVPIDDEKQKCQLEDEEEAD